ncbi:MAG TPA: hypothetical protein VIJ11_12870, partial [Galbitalea sp.]
STVEENLRAYLEFGLNTLGRVLPAFGGIIGQPNVLARFADHFSSDFGAGIHDLFGNYLRAEQALGRIAADADVSATAILIVGACHTEALPSLLRGAPENNPIVRPGFVDGLISTILHGIAPR